VFLCWKSWHDFGMNFKIDLHEFIREVIVLHMQYRINIYMWNDMSVRHMLLIYSA
jgi:hypothetical protein